MNFDQIKKWYVDNGMVFYASFEITQNCNFNCKHCYCPDKKTKNMTFEEAKCIVDKLYEVGCFLLIFTGGEVFTCSYFKELYVYAKKKGFMIDLMTNGSLIDEDILAMFKKYPPHNISITVYGTNEDEYAQFTGNRENYFSVMKTLDLLKKEQLAFNIRTVATKTLYNAIANGSFDLLAEKLNVPFRYDPIIFPKVTGDKTPLNECLSPSEIVQLENANELRSKSWKEILSIRNTFDWKCRAGENSLAIDYKGNAYVCGLYREKGISLLTEDIAVVMKHLSDIHEKHKCIVHKSECNECKYRNICKWCPAYSLVYNGNENCKIPFFCELARCRSKTFERK